MNTMIEAMLDDVADRTVLTDEDRESLWVKWDSRLTTYRNELAALAGERVKAMAAKVEEEMKL